MQTAARTAGAPKTIEERVQRLAQANRRECQRRLCYAAAMGRAFNVPASVFMEAGPKTWPLSARKFVYRSAEENGGVKSLLELCLDYLDAAYVTMGELAGPSKRWRDAELALPTPVEHNRKLCKVTEGERRVVVWSNVF